MNDIKIKIFNYGKICSIVEKRNGIWSFVALGSNAANVYFRAPIDDYKVDKFLRSRVFPNREDHSTRKALDILQIPIYDHMEIVKKTHGKMLSDGITLEILE